MKKYIIHIRVKFRAFGVTFGTVERDIEIFETDPFPLMPVGTLCDDRGVKATARWE